MGDLLLSVLLLLGCGFILTAGIGILRFREPLRQAHAISKALTLGVILILIGLLTVIGSPISAIKILFALIFNFITIPIAGHIFGLYTTTQK